MPRRPVTRQAPQQPHSHGSGSLVGHFSAILNHVDGLAQRLGATLASIIVLTVLTLVSLYFMRDTVVGIVAIYLIAVIATVFTRWQRLDQG